MMTEDKQLNKEAEVGRTIMKMFKDDPVIMIEFLRRRDLTLTKIEAELKTMAPLSTIKKLCKKVHECVKCCTCTCNCEEEELNCPLAMIKTMKDDETG